MFIPRALIVSAGFLLAGLLGLGAYFLPVFQAAGSTASTGAIPNLDPIHPSTAPFTVLLLGSDDDAKFPPDRLNTQSMILVRVDPAARQATLLSIPRDLWVPIPDQGRGQDQHCIPARVGRSGCDRGGGKQLQGPCRRLRLDRLERARQADRPAGRCESRA